MKPNYEYATTNECYINQSTDAPGLTVHYTTRYLSRQLRCHISKHTGIIIIILFAHNIQTV